MTTLPSDFADLEPFADWSLRTESERYAKRLSSTMDELQAFYDACLPPPRCGIGLPRPVRPARPSRGCHPTAVAVLLPGERLFSC